jgi:hypothetical protein
VTTTSNPRHPARHGGGDDARGAARQGPRGASEEVPHGPTARRR